ncbi:Gfo/Idh/MocA family protein [Aliikangiella maris]|uniref:Gfo/Idh/MocA family oxidoreductase n=2 Tax=Aliikangiella maris TaxID=3162458 RepID=A0ABV2BVT6_9GAMM
MRTVQWGFIGCGNVTEVKSGPAYQKVDGFKVFAVMRRDQLAAQDYAKRHHITNVFSSAAELINHSQVDAVYIATPPDSHKELALQVAQVGKPCCIEKPLAPDYAQSLQIVEAFNQAQTPLWVAYYRRSLPRFNAILQKLNAGVIGQVRHYQWCLNRSANAVDLAQHYQWRTDKKIALGGYFDDLACHGLDLFAYFFGDFERVYGVAHQQQQLYSAYDSVAASWKHSQGITATANWNFGGFTRRDRVTIFGSEGEIEFSIFDEQPIVINTAEGEQFYEIENPLNIQLYHVQKIRDFLFDQQPHPSTGKSALHTSWVMEQILHS